MSSSETIPSLDVSDSNDDSSDTEDVKIEEELESPSTASPPEEDQVTSGPSLDEPPPADDDSNSEELKNLRREAETLRNTVARLTEERDAAVVGSASAEQHHESSSKELQDTLHSQMSARAEIEDMLRQSETELERHRELSDRLPTLEATNKSLESEVTKLRSLKEQHTMDEALHQNRLNDSKKQEANASHKLASLRSDHDTLVTRHEETERERASLAESKETLEKSLQKLKTKSKTVIQSAQADLAQEKQVNLDRKSKMKAFVQKKADELRVVKNQNDKLVNELEESRTKLRGLRQELEVCHSRLSEEGSTIEKLESTVQRIKKNTSALHSEGKSLSQKIQVQQNQTEEHKTKRLEAKHELMTVLRKLENAEVMKKTLQDSLKFSFTSKALSQQQLLREGIGNLNEGLEHLSKKMGRTLPEVPSQVRAVMNGEKIAMEGDSSPKQTNGTKSNRRLERKQGESSHLVSNLENETQRVSQGIMAFMTCVERLNFVMDDANFESKNCVDSIMNMLHAKNVGETKRMTMGENGERKEKGVVILGKKNRYGRVQGGLEGVRDIGDEELL